MNVYRDLHTTLSPLTYEMAKLLRRRNRTEYIVIVSGS